MRRVAAFWIAALAVLCVVVPALAGEGLTRVSENVYSYVGVEDDSPARSFGANAGIVVGRDGILVVDTLVSAKEAGRFIADIRKVSDKPIRYVVNTHCHLDHAFGNSEFGKLGAVVVAHEDCAAYLKEQGVETLKNIGEFGLTGEQMEGTEIEQPDIVFNDRLEIDLGGLTVRLVSAGPAHVKGSIFAFVPEEKVLFAGDVLFTDYHPFSGEGDLGVWLKALDSMEAIGAEKFVPGHGPLSAKKDIQDMKSYLVEFDRRAREISSSSEDPDFITAEMIKVLPSRKHGMGLIKYNIVMKYLEKKG